MAGYLARPGDAVGVCGNRPTHKYARIRDLIRWISGNSASRRDYPEWEVRYDLRDILEDMYETNRSTWR